MAKSRRPRLADYCRLRLLLDSEVQYFYRIPLPQLYEHPNRNQAGPRPGATLIGRGFKVPFLTIVVNLVKLTGLFFTGRPVSFGSGKGPQFLGFARNRIRTTKVQ